MSSHANHAAELALLRTRLQASEAAVMRLQETVDAQQIVIDSRHSEIERLNLLIAKLRRLQYGRKSEKLARDIDQLELRLEELQADASAACIVEPEPVKVSRPVSRRASLPPHLPRDVRTHLPEDAGTCSACGGAMKRLGEDVSEQLEYVPARFKVIRKRHLSTV